MQDRINYSQSLLRYQIKALNTVALSIGIRPRESGNQRAAIIGGAELKHRLSTLPERDDLGEEMRG